MTRISSNGRGAVPRGRWLAAAIAILLLGAAGLAWPQMDTDGDGVDDGIDVCPFVADPDQADFDTDGQGDACEDSDDDELLDAEELAAGTDPLDPDGDDDLVLDGEEILYAETDPGAADSDGDGSDDLVENLAVIPEPFGAGGSDIMIPTLSPWGLALIAVLLAALALAGLRRALHASSIRAR